MAADPLLPFVVGFTGTTVGLTAPQAERVREILARLIAEEGADRFVHGCCVGADEEAAAIARDLGLRVIGVPGREVGAFRRSTFRNDVEFAVQKGKNPELTRNRRIAKVSSVLVVCPRSTKAALRSGTWSAVRAALKAGTKTIVVYPHGELAQAIPGPRPVGLALAPLTPLRRAS